MLGSLVTGNYLAYQQKKEEDKKRSDAGSMGFLIVVGLFNLIWLGIFIYILYYNFVFASRCHNGSILHYLLGFFFATFYFIYRLIVVYGTKSKAMCFKKM